LLPGGRPPRFREASEPVSFSRGPGPAAPACAGEARGAGETRTLGTLDDGAAPLQSSNGIPRGERISADGRDDRRRGPLLCRPNPWGYRGSTRARDGTRPMCAANPVHRGNLKKAEEICFFSRPAPPSTTANGRSQSLLELSAYRVQPTPRNIFFVSSRLPKTGGSWVACPSNHVLPPKPIKSSRSTFDARSDIFMPWGPSFFLIFLAHQGPAVHVGNPHVRFVSAMCF